MVRMPSGSIGHARQSIVTVWGMRHNEAGWTYASAWVARMRSWAAACQVLIVPSASLIPRAQALLGLAPERCVHLSNGFAYECLMVSPVVDLDQERAFTAHHQLVPPRSGPQ